MGSNLACGSHGQPKTAARTRQKKAAPLTTEEQEYRLQKKLRALKWH
jgi:hypothetical protein